MNVRIKNKLLLFSITLLSCNGIREKNDTVNKINQVNTSKSVKPVISDTIPPIIFPFTIQYKETGCVRQKNYTSSSVHFKTLGEMRFDSLGYIEYSHSPTDTSIICAPFKITFSTDAIKLKKKYYHFYIDNYACELTVLYIFKKVRINKYALNIIQMTRHTSIDEVVFSKTPNGLFDISNIKQIQPSSTGDKVLFYKKNVTKDSIINLSNLKGK
ncbi:hypothetical protein ACI6Q2_21760 [Chitinophagaceae bacterium LWZ2-11]